MQYVYLLTCGDGSDGDEWGVISIHATIESAERAKKEYEIPMIRGDSSTYKREAQIEKWVVEN